MVYSLVCTSFLLGPRSDCLELWTTNFPFHSIFIAFAPKEDPEIAIAVYVENQGFGTTYAAPIASLMIEKYLTGEVKRTWYENWVMQKEQPVVVRATIPSSDTTLTGPGTDSVSTGQIQ